MRIHTHTQMSIKPCFGAKNFVCGPRQREKHDVTPVHSSPHTRARITVFVDSFLPCHPPQANARGASAHVFKRSVDTIFHPCYPHQRTDIHRAYTLAYAHTHSEDFHALIARACRQARSGKPQAPLLAPTCARLSSDRAVPIGALSSGRGAKLGRGDI